MTHLLAILQFTAELAIVYGITIFCLVSLIVIVARESRVSSFARRKLPRLV